MNITESIKSGLAEVVLNWGATRETLEQKGADAEARVAALKARKDDVVVDAAMGNKAAQTELGRIEVELAAAEAEAERMRYALTRATDRENARLEEERQLAERMELKRRWDIVDAKLAERQKVAARIDQVGEEYAALIAKLATLGLEAHAEAPVKDFNNQHETVLRAQSAENIVCVALKKLGVPWAVPNVSEVPGALPVAEAVTKQHEEFLSHKDKK